MSRLASHAACGLIALVVGVAIGQRQVARHRMEPGERRPEVRVPAVDARSPLVEEAAKAEAAEDAPIERPAAPAKGAWAALDALKRMDDPVARLERLRELLASADARVVERAAALISEIGGPEALVLAGGLLASHGASRVRRQAARELGQIGGVDARGPLLRAFAMDESLRVRTVAAFELARLGDPAPREALVVHLAGHLEHPDGTQRRDAVERLGDLRAESALVPLGRALKDANSEVRRAAVEAVARVECAQAKSLLEEACRDANPMVAREAARALDK